MSDYFTLTPIPNPNLVSYSQAAMEDRSAPRVRLRIPAILRPSGFPGFSVIVKDISLSGFSAEALTGMKAGTRVWLTVPGLAPLQSVIEWNDGTLIGCSFQNLLNRAVLESLVRQHSAEFAYG